MYLSESPWCMASPNPFGLRQKKRVEETEETSNVLVTRSRRPQSLTVRKDGNGELLHRSYELVSYMTC